MRVTEYLDNSTKSEINWFLFSKLGFQISRQFGSKTNCRTIMNVSDERKSGCHTPPAPMGRTACTQGLSILASSAPLSRCTFLAAGSIVLTGHTNLESQSGSHLVCLHKGLVVIQTQEYMRVLGYPENQSRFSSTFLYPHMLMRTKKERLFWKVLFPNALPCCQ